MLEYGITVSGYGQITRNLDQMPVVVRQILKAKFKQLAEDMRVDLEEDIYNKMQGDESTGELAESAQAYVEDKNGEVTLVVGFDGTVEYARIQDKGGTTSAHMIYPNKGRVLAFMGFQGKMAFSTRVFHPGSVIPAKNYLKDLRRKYAARIASETKKAIVQGIRQNMRGMK